VAALEENIKKTRFEGERERGREGERDRGAYL